MTQTDLLLYFEDESCDCSVRARITETENYPRPENLQM